MWFDSSNDSFSFVSFQTLSKKWLLAFKSIGPSIFVQEAYNNNGIYLVSYKWTQLGYQNNKDGTVSEDFQNFVHGSSYKLRSVDIVSLNENLVDCIHYKCSGVMTHTKTRGPLLSMPVLYAVLCTCHPRGLGIESLSSSSAFQR